MSLTDEQLKQLIVSIYGNPEPGSLERRRAINRLLIILQQLPGLLKSSHLYYLEALDQTWEWVSRNICAFKPRPHLSIQESLTRWINGYLSWRIRDLYRREDRNLCSLDSPIDHSSDENPTTLLEKLTETGFVPPQLSGIDGYIEQVRRQERQDQLGQLERYVLDDPQGILKGCCHPKYPKCNCQFLSLRLLFKEPPERLADISREFNIDRQIITYHWKRKCKPLLQAILKSQGYSGDEE